MHKNNIYSHTNLHIYNKTFYLLGFFNILTREMPLEAKN